MKLEIHFWKESSNRNAPACLYSPGSPGLMMLPLPVLSSRLPQLSLLITQVPALMMPCCLFFLFLCFLVLTLWLLLAIDSINSSFTRSHRTIQKLETPFKIRYSCKLIREYTFFFKKKKRLTLRDFLNNQPTTTNPMPAVSSKTLRVAATEACGAWEQRGMHGKGHAWKADELCSKTLTHTTRHLHASWVIKPTSLLQIPWFHSHDTWELGKLEAGKQPGGCYGWSYQRGQLRRAACHYAALQKKNFS